MELIELKRLGLSSLDAQIRSLGGEGYNLAVKFLGRDPSRIGVMYWRLADGCVIHSTNELTVGYCEWEGNKLEIMFDFDAGQFKADTICQNESGRFIGASVTLGRSAVEARDQLHKIAPSWSIRLLGMFEDPHAAVRETKQVFFYSPWPELIEDTTQYVGVHVSGVRNHGTPEDTDIEMDNDDPEFFSVYLQYEEGGCLCVGDFADYADALKWATSLADKHRWWLRDNFKIQQTAGAKA